MKNYLGGFCIILFACSTGIGSSEGSKVDPGAGDGSDVQAVDTSQCVDIRRDARDAKNLGLDQASNIKVCNGDKIMFIQAGEDNWALYEANVEEAISERQLAVSIRRHHPKLYRELRLTPDNPEPYCTDNGENLVDFGGEGPYVILNVAHSALATPAELGCE